MQWSDDNDDEVDEGGNEIILSDEEYVSGPFPPLVVTAWGSFISQNYFSSPFIPTPATTEPVINYIF